MTLPINNANVTLSYENGRFLMWIRTAQGRSLFNISAKRIEYISRDLGLPILDKDQEEKNFNQLRHKKGL